MYFAGVDVGSTQTKTALVDEQQRVVARSLTNTGANILRAAERAYQEVLQLAGITTSDVAYVVGTGYGRFRVTFGDTQISEITCHARGAISFFPNTRTVLDIGGQDSKAIKVGPSGEVLDFTMNDKCAAGTGRFLQMAAMTLNKSLDDIGPMSLQSTAPLGITTTCTVFVESEIVSYLARGKKGEDILRGMHNAIASRCQSLLRRVGIREEITFTGGVSRNIGLVRALEETLGHPINVSPEAHFLGAIGAAMFARDRALADLFAQRQTAEA